MGKYKAIRYKDHFSSLVDKRSLGILLALITVSFIALVYSTGTGTVQIGFFKVLNAVIGKGVSMDVLVVQSFRLPRIIIAFLVGAALATSGAILQGIIRNPLASPDILGITGGASSAAVAFLAIYSDSSNNSLTVSIHWLPLAAFIGATVIALTVYILSWKNGVSPIRLVLIGIGISAAMQALTTMMILLGPLYLATQATIWLTGSVYGSNWNDVITLTSWIFLCVPIILVSIRKLNIQELGDEIATGVGSSLQKDRLLLLLLSTALAGGAVSVGGGIGFVGLMAPHIARQLVGSSFGILIPISALTGGIIVLVADLLGRTLFAPLDLPAGIFTAAIGAPYFIYLLYKNRNI